MNSFFQAFSLFIFIIFHSVADETFSDIDTQVNTNPFLISDVQQAHFTDNPLGQPEPGSGSSINAGTSPDELLAEESASCLHINQDNLNGKSRVRRRSPQSNLCPSPPTPEADFRKEPEASQNAGGDGGSGPSRSRKIKPIPSPFDPLNMPKYPPGKTIENPCAGEIINRNPVCDSGYFGPTTSLGSCRLWTPYLDCIHNLENLWCCVVVRPQPPPLALMSDWSPPQQQLAYKPDPAYPYYGIQCKLQPMRPPGR